MASMRMGSTDRGIWKLRNRTGTSSTIQFCHTIVPVTTRIRAQAAILKFRAVSHVAAGLSVVPLASSLVMIPPCGHASIYSDFALAGLSRYSVPQRRPETAFLLGCYTVRITARQFSVGRPALRYL